MKSLLDCVFNFIDTWDKELIARIYREYGNSEYLDQALYGSSVFVKHNNMCFEIELGVLNDDIYAIVRLREGSAFDYWVACFSFNKDLIDIKASDDCGSLSFTEAVIKTEELICPDLAALAKHDERYSLKDKQDDMSALEEWPEQARSCYCSMIETNPFLVAQEKPSDPYLQIFREHVVRLLVIATIEVEKSDMGYWDDICFAKDYEQIADEMTESRPSRISKWVQNTLSNWAPFSYIYENDCFTNYYKELLKKYSCKLPLDVVLQLDIEKLIKNNFKLK